MFWLKVRAAVFLLALVGSIFAVLGMIGAILYAIAVP